MTTDKTISFGIKKTNSFPKTNNRGMALIMVLSTIVFIVLLVQETVFETQIEHRSAIAELNSLRAHHAAKSGMEVNILRVRTYIKLTTQYAQQIQPFRSYVDLIYQFPFHWPPLKPDGLDLISAKKFSKIKENSFMQGSFFVTSIEPETSRIDINDLASPIPSLRKWTFQVLYRLIYHLQLNNKKLAAEINEKNIFEILNNIKDWVDPDRQQTGQNQISENNLYSHDRLPRNRSFISLQELHEVAGMSDTLYTALTPFITIHGEKGLNINSAPPELLQALHDSFPMELAQEIAELTSIPLNPFIFTKQIFSDFLVEKGFSNLKQYFFPKREKNTDKKEQSIPYLYFDAPHNFQMKSTGIAGNSQKTITAIYFNTSSFIKRFKTLMEKEKKREKKRIAAQLSTRQIRMRNQQSNPPPSTNTPTPSKQNQKPTIIYWKESF